ncbi:TerD family protein [Streptomyces sp. NPDC058653]|uniref:TerD family protein n=1 Tax=Streptomyces sp. NPDC058653 TaxID=3346576 RepID=UPI003667A979
MLEMVKGANVALDVLSEDISAVVLSLAWRSATGDGDADVSLLLVGGNGKVRSDADFFFYNNPASADGSVQLLGKTPTADGSEDRITLDLSAMSSGVERVVLAASRYGGARFGDLDELRITLADRTGEPLLTFSIDDADTESAFIFGELYRRGEEWKFRAVGQGYASGLAGLATDFGIDVDDASEEEPEVPVADAAPAPSAAVSVTPATEPPATLPAQPTAPKAVGVPAPRRPRTAKKKVVLPRTGGKSLAESDAWRRARLFPVPSLKSDREREMRATSILLSVMAQVPEYGRRLTAAFGAPAGRTETFTEVSLPYGDTPKRPDGVIRVERAGKLWTALVETKTNGNALRADQVQDYMDIAARRGYEAVITLSNDVALDGRPPVDVKVDGRRKHKVALWHLSWAEVAHQAQMLIRHEGVGNAAHAWLLLELLQYLQHENSGCHGFQNMGPAWVPVRKGIDEETLCQGDPHAIQVVESWERLVRQVCLRLGGELGQKVLPVQRAKRGTDPHTRRATLADQLCDDGRLHAELRIDGTQGALSVAADLRTGRLRTSIDLAAPEQGYPLTWAKRLIRQLTEAPADLHIETLIEGQGGGPRGTLERLRREPADMLPRDGAQIAGFRLSLLKGMGSTRGNSDSGFIRSVDDAVDRFYTGVVAHLERRPTRRPQLTETTAG